MKYQCDIHGHESHFEDCPACRSYRNEPLEKVVSNPKEFWVYKMSCVDWDVSGAEPTNKKYTHVIEYSAYDELKAKAVALTEVLVQLKAFNHHKIDEELWRIDQVVRANGVTIAEEYK